MKKKGTFASYIKEMARINGQVVLPDTKSYKKRKERSKETQPRKQDEAEFRRQVIKDLRGHGCIIKRIENGIGGDIGTSLPDLLVFTNDLYPPIKMVWLELKSLSGVLSYGQKRFQSLCELAGIKHIVPRPGQDVWEMVKCA